MATADLDAELDLVDRYARSARDHVAQLADEVDAMQTTIGTGDVDPSLIALGRVLFVVDQLRESLAGVQEHLLVARDSITMSQRDAGRSR